MEAFRLRRDLRRAVIDGFALPLGLDPGQIKGPAAGYTISYSAATDDEPDTYSFYVAVSHERIAAIARRALALLPRRVCAIVEISSRDAYRQTDVYLSDEEISRRDFLAGWREWEAVLLEDGAIGAGANSEHPFIEVFLDQWKGLSIIVPLGMREQVESMLAEFGLEEVPETWAVGEDNPGLDEVQIRSVLESGEDLVADIDDVLQALRSQWCLELNVDRDTNVDEGGRRLGLTLWHALVGVRSADGGNAPPEEADLSVWATAGSLSELERLIDEALIEAGQWEFVDLYWTDRVAFDERPADLADLALRRERAEIHVLSVERRWPVAGVAPS
jgi:hypothetical protein